MAPGYSISGIGLNPLGNLGLGMSGQFGSYDAYMPSNIGMNYGMMAPGMGMMNPMMSMMNPMMGMYPQYLTQMQDAQHQIEISKAEHNSAMHNILLNNEIAAHRESDSALMKKTLTNGDIKQGIQNLYDKVREGDQDGICSEFDKLKTYIYNTYKDEFAARGDKINPSVAATQKIEELYGQMISAQCGGEVHDLRSDIKRYGDNSFQNGFLNGFRTGHHDRYIDETLNHCFGEEIDQKGSKDFKQTLGIGVGKTASVLEKGAYGALAGVGAAGLGLGLGKVVSFGKLPWTKCMSKTWKPAMCIGLLAGMVGDILWQSSKA